MHLMHCQPVMLGGQVLEYHFGVQVYFLDRAYRWVLDDVAAAVAGIVAVVVDELAAVVAAELVAVVVVVAAGVVAVVAAGLVVVVAAGLVVVAEWLRSGVVTPVRTEEWPCVGVAAGECWHY